MRLLVFITVIGLPLADLAWNLAHLNIGLADFFGLAAFAHGFVAHHVWPATPYFPPGYPLLLVPFGVAGSALIGGYVLSAIGLCLALWALYRLGREWGLARGVALLICVFAWLDPVYRPPAGSPTVDALYTGLGMWLIAAAIALWRRRNEAVDPRWINLGLLVPSAVLPLIRYHAVILVAPVLLVLLLALPGKRALSAMALLVLALSIGYNYASYYAAYGKAIPSAVGIQMRSGLEYDFQTTYKTPEHLYADYPAFCAHARAVPVTADYTLSQLARHTADAWYHYLRRPSIVLAGLLVILLLVYRRPVPRGAVLLLLWIACYTLALSPAYYTPRAGLLPAIAATSLCFAAAAQLLAGRPGVAALGVCVLLLLGFSVSNRYSRAEFAERRHFAQASRAVEQQLGLWGIRAGQVVTSDWRVMPLKGNRWCAPYPHTELSWLDDPEISRAQVPGIVAYSIDDLVAGIAPVKLVILRPGHPRAEELAAVAASPRWRLARELLGLKLYVREGFSAGGA